MRLGMGIEVLIFEKSTLSRREPFETLGIYACPLERTNDEKTNIQLWNLNASGIYRLDGMSRFNRALRLTERHLLSSGRRQPCESKMS